MNSEAASDTQSSRSSRLTNLQIRVASFAAGVMILGGLATLAAGPMEEAVATLDQHELAVEGDTRIARYANALGAAYDVVADDFEDALVSFEFGALPTTVDGEVLGVPRPAQDLGPVNDRPEEETSPVIAVDHTPTDHVADPEPPDVFDGGVIRIPAIGLNQSVVEGVTREHLKLGPGHYPGTALPGQEGNVVISGHRTTYSRPFHDLDRLEPGDAIFIDTSEGTHAYRVSETLVVSADNAEPLRDTVDARLTLTTCHPKGSAKQRLVVIAVYDDAPDDGSDRR